MNDVISKLAAAPIQTTETALAAWDKSNQSIVVRSAARAASVVAVEVLAIASLIYHGIALSSKAAQLASRTLLCKLPIAKAQNSWRRPGKGTYLEGYRSRACPQRTRRISVYAPHARRRVRSDSKDASAAATDRSKSCSARIHICQAAKGIGRVGRLRDPGNVMVFQPAWKA